MGDSPKPPRHVSGFFSARDGFDPKKSPRNFRSFSQQSDMPFSDMAMDH